MPQKHILGQHFFQDEKDSSGLDYIEEVKDKILGSTEEPFTFGDFLVCFAQLWYMLMMVLFAIGTVLMMSAAAAVQYIYKKRLAK